MARAWKQWQSAIHAARELTYSPQTQHRLVLSPLDQVKRQRIVLNDIVMQLEA
jgi:hypothetical protein